MAPCGGASPTLSRDVGACALHRHGTGMLGAHTSGVLPRAHEGSSPHRFDRVRCRAFAHRGRSRPVHVDCDDPRSHALPPRGRRLIPECSILSSTRTLTRTLTATMTSPRSLTLHLDCRVKQPPAGEADASRSLAARPWSRCGRRCSEFDVEVDGGVDIVRRRQPRRSGSASTSNRRRRTTACVPNCRFLFIAGSICPVARHGTNISRNKPVRRHAYKHASNVIKHTLFHGCDTPWDRHPSVWPRGGQGVFLCRFGHKRLDRARLTE
jgi:hypothetical protein